jgi:hypothetical protein
MRYRCACRALPLHVEGWGHVGVRVGSPVQAYVHVVVDVHVETHAHMYVTCARVCAPACFCVCVAVFMLMRVFVRLCVVGVCRSGSLSSRTGSHAVAGAPFCVSEGGVPGGSPSAEKDVCACVCFAFVCLCGSVVRSL